MPLSAGDILGPYEILAPLGAGGMGEVWKAHDARLNRTVAIKRLQGRHTARFEQEAQSIAALNHPISARSSTLVPITLRSNTSRGIRSWGHDVLLIGN